MSMRYAIAVGILPLLLASCGSRSEPPCNLQGCDGAVQCERPAEPDLPGPWPVGVRTLQAAGLQTEVWYPAAFGSQDGLEQTVYDLRRELPWAEQDKIPDEDNPWLVCDCYRDLPLDDRHGPYPVVFFLHGTASFRMQSLGTMVHWASRGFVVLAANYPGLMLADLLQGNVDADLPGDTTRLLAALDPPSGELAFLAGFVDAERVGLAGHSAGGLALKSLAALPGVQAALPMAAEAINPVDRPVSLLVLGAVDDQIVPFSRQQAGYDSSAPPKRLVGLSNAGHMAFSELCGLKNARGQDLVDVAIEHQVTNASLATAMWDGCEPDQLDPVQALKIVNFATTAVLEEALQCAPESGALAAIRQRFSEVGEIRQEL